jgi:glycosyltransferase EpsD
MVNKILYCATVDYHFKAFHLPYMKWFKERGWQVDVAAAGEIALPYTDNKYNVPMQRSPFNKKNIEAYRMLKEIIDKNNYNIIHCHTPLGGALGRIAARKAREKGTKIIYTAHGFHFCKGAPLHNWMIYYPIERYLSRYTDSLITINSEDFNLAINHQFKAETIEHVYGVGIDTERFKPVDENRKSALKESFGYQSDDFLLFNVGEFNKNKNQQFLIRALEKLKYVRPNIKLLLAGEGEMLPDCKRLARKLGVVHMVKFLGFRKDIENILSGCDLVVASSIREGLPVNIMEAMSSGLPVLAMENRGNRDLIDHHQNGLLLTKWNPTLFAERVKMLANEADFRIQLGQNGREKIIDKYSIKKVLSEKTRIYEAYMQGGERLWATH